MSPPPIPRRFASPAQVQAAVGATTSVDDPALAARQAWDLRQFDGLRAAGIALRLLRVDAPVPAAADTAFGALPHDDAPRQDTNPPPTAAQPPDPMLLAVQSAQIAKATAALARDKSELHDLDSINVGVLCLVLAQISCLRGETLHAGRLLEQARRRFAPAGCDAGLSDVAWLAAQMHHELGAEPQRDRALQQSLNHALACADGQRIQSCRLTIACAATLKDDRQGADEKAPFVTPHLDSPDVALRALANSFFLSYHLIRDNHAQAVRHGMVGQQCALDCGLPYIALHDGAQISSFLLDIGDAAGASAQLADLVALARRCGWPAPLSRALALQARCLSRQKEHEAAVRTAGEALRLVSTSAGTQSHLMALETLAEAELAAEHADAAEVAFGEMLLLARSASQPDTQGSAGSKPPEDAIALAGRSHLGLARVQLQRGMLPQCYRSATQALLAARRLADQKAAVAALRLMAVVTTRIPAAALIDGGNPARTARDLLEEASQSAAALAPWEGHDEMLLEYARILHSAGDLQAALQITRKAYDALRALSAQQLRNQSIAIQVTITSTTQQIRPTDPHLQHRAEQSEEAQRSANLQALNEQLRSALEALQSTQALLLSRNEELTTAYDQISELSLTDPLTGLRNRRFFDQVIDGCVSETLRGYTPNSFESADETADDARQDLLFFMIDMDHFKSANDQYGHAAGDQLLVQVRDRLRTVAREEDYLIRWGGEEFLLTVRATPRRHAADIADRLLYAVSSNAFDLAPGVRVRKTCSIGYCAFPVDQTDPRGHTWRQAVEIADARLLAAKREGRNRAVGPNDRLDPSFAETT